MNTANQLPELGLYDAGLLNDFGGGTCSLTRTLASRINFQPRLHARDERVRML